MKKLGNTLFRKKYIIYYEINQQKNVCLDVIFANRKKIRFNERWEVGVYEKLNYMNSSVVYTINYN